MAKSETDQLRAELRELKMAHSKKEQQWLQEKEQLVQKVYELQHLVSDLKSQLPLKKN